MSALRGALGASSKIESEVREIVASFETVRPFCTNLPNLSFSSLNSLSPLILISITIPVRSLKLAPNASAPTAARLANSGSEEPQPKYATCRLKFKPTQVFGNSLYTKNEKKGFLESTELI